MKVNSRAKPDFAMLIDSIARRPAMYVGNTSLRSIGHYLAGYCHALDEAAISTTTFRGFTIWLSERFLIFHSAWHWTRILLHTYQTDEAAIEALPDLFAEYLRTKDGKSLHQLEVDRDKALVTAYGIEWGAPEDTHTTPIS
jgi:hypothetical protein